MLIKLVFLVALFVTSIMAALSQQEMADALIKVEKDEDLVKTFKKFEREQNEYELSWALAEVAEVQEPYLRLPLVLEQLLISSQLKCQM